MKYIENLREGEHTSDIYLCKQKQTLKTKAGKNYFSMILQDKTGTIDAKIWDLSNGINHFEAMDYIQVEADITSYQGALQMNVRRVRLAQENEFQSSDYLPVSPFPLEEMYQELLGLVNSISNSKLQELLRSFFVEDADFIRAFKTHSAAKSIHHGFVGGLLQHTLAVARLCEYYCTRYPVLNRDLLISAALFHDIGKVKELSPFPENAYTDDGQMLGHIVIGYEMVSERIKTIPGFPPGTAMELKHCILSHHGEYEYGSPKKPAIIEAVALNFADNTDAKLQALTEFIEGNHADTEWLGYHKQLETNFKRTNQL